MQSKKSKPLKNKLLLLLLIGLLSMQSCFLRKKNRCNTCPKWSQIEQDQKLVVENEEV